MMTSIVTVVPYKYEIGQLHELLIFIIILMTTSIENCYYSRHGKFHVLA